MNHLLCLGTLVLVILIQGVTSQRNKESNSATLTKPTTSEEDLCKHPFHSFLCNPAAKSGHKRRIYNGQKPGPPPPPNSNQLTGENSFIQSTQLRPDVPKKTLPVFEQKLKPDTSNIAPVFEAPGYLPPNSEKPSGNLFGDNSFLDSAKLLPPTTKSPRPTTPRPTTPRPTTPRPTTPRPTTPRPTTPRPTTPRPTTPRPVLKVITTPVPITTRRPTTPVPITTRRPTTQRTTTEPNIQADGAQNSGTRIRPDTATPVKDDLCAHSFHSFLCNPAAKSGHKRRIYNGQKPGPPPPPNSIQLTGENSFIQSTQLRPDVPQKTLPVFEPKLKPDTSNIAPVFEAPGYLPPNSEKPSGNLFGDNSFLDSAKLLPPTTKSPRPTTPRPTTPRPTTPRPTTPRPTTPRPTTPRPTTPRPVLKVITTPVPITTRRPTTPVPITTRRPTTQRTTTEPNIQADGAQNSGTRIRPDTAKPVKDDLCAHSFHSFLCNPPAKSGHKRRIYNGQKPGPPPPPNSIQLTGENSFIQSTQLRPDVPKKTLPVFEPKLKPDTSNIAPVFEAPGYLPPNSEKPSGNLFGDNSFLDSAKLLPPTTKSPRPTTPRPTTPRPTTPRPITPRPATPRPTTPRPTTPRPTTPRPVLKVITTPVPITTRRPTTPVPIATRRPTTQRTTTEPNIQADGAQNSGTRIRPDSAKPVKDDLCAHSFHSFLCDSPKPTRPRRIYNGRISSPENSNILGENSFQQPSRILPPTTPSSKSLPTKTFTYTPIPVRQTTVRSTTKPVQNQNIIGENSYLSPSKLLPTSTQAPVRKTPSTITSKPTRRPVIIKDEPDIQPDGAQNPSVRLRPDASEPTGKEDLCKHAFHSFLCNGAKPAGKRRNYNGQNPNILGSNSFVNSKSLLPPQPKRTPEPRKENEFQQSTNLNIEVLNTASNSYLPPAPYLPPTLFKRTVRQNRQISDSSDVHHHTDVPLPTSKPIPASLARGNPPTTSRPNSEVDKEGSAADAPNVIVSPADNHDHHHDAADHHHDAAGHGHDHAHGDHHGAHGDHHGDHHHHHHNITLEQLCRDPFHAFLCLNVDTSKRRIYDGNPAQGTPSEQETLQALSRSQLQAASSVRQLRKINSPQDSPSSNDIPNLQPSSFIQENGAQFKFQSYEPTVSNIDVVTENQYISTSSSVLTTSTPQYKSTESTRTQSATGSFLQNAREQVYNPAPNQNTNLQNEEKVTDAASHEITEPQNADEVVTRPAQPEGVPNSHRPRGSVRQSSQRRPVLSEPSPTPDTLTQQPIYRQRRPLRRKQQTTTAETTDLNTKNEDISSQLTESHKSPVNVNRRSDEGENSQQSQPRKRKFGEKVPRRRRLPVQDRDLTSEITEPLNPAKFVRGPRGIVSDLAATNAAPEVQCTEPFHAYQCNPKLISHREKRSAKEDSNEPRRVGNMRGQPQGQEPEQGKEEEPRKVVETRKERIRQKNKVKAEERAKVEETNVEKHDKTKMSTTEDPMVVYQREIEEELKQREIEENNRKEELKRRAEELKRREKEQEGRKEETKRRKEELARRKADDEKRKQELKRLKDENKSDDDDDDTDIESEDDEEKREEEEKDKLLTDYEKGVKADIKLREAEVKLREAELVRREQELIRREVEEKRRLMEVERRRVQDKRIEEELERQRLEKIRVAEELVRRQEEDDRRSAAKLKAESN